MRWVALGASAAAIILSLPNLFVTAIIAPLLVATALVEISVYRKAATALGAIRLWWAVPLFMLWRPVGNFLFRISRYSHRKKNFTWQRTRKK